MRHHITDNEQLRFSTNNNAEVKDLFLSPFIGCGVATPRQFLFSSQKSDITMQQDSQEEIWKDIEGYEGYYQISNLGRVKRLPGFINGRTPEFKKFWKGRILKPGRTGLNYQHVELCVNNKHQLCLIHRLVAAAFLPRIIDKNWVNHIDGDPSNNNVNNLEWCTPSENELHKIHVLNKRPGIKNFNVQECEFPIKFNGKNIYGLKLQETLKRFLKGEVIIPYKLKRIERRRFYSYYNELRKFGVPVKSEWVNVANHKDRGFGGPCKKYFIDPADLKKAGIPIKDITLKGGAKQWYL
jgi:hypothetical protein